MPKPATFWDNRFDTDEYVYGSRPNDFVVEAAGTWLDAPQDVLDLGVGEGRNAVYLAQQGHAVTAVDYSARGLRKTRRLADETGVEVETIEADVRDWGPERDWDAIVVTFLHLPPDERPPLYRFLREYLRPGGVLIAEWFRPEQRTQNYTSGGPPDPEMMVTADELREHFSEAGIARLEIAEPILEEGMHQGPAATVQFVWGKEGD